jgi:hypothetical protein
MSVNNDAVALAKREPTISKADHDAISKAARAELRDRFAGYALIGLLASAECSFISSDETAALAWKQADAMMKARGE